MNYKDVLVAFYSRTGITKKVAEKLKELYGFELEEIIDKKPRMGALNYVIAGREAMLEKETDIEEIKENPKKYDLVIIATPTWASNMSPAVRTYINKFNGELNNITFICTQLGGGAEKALVKLESLIGKESKGNMVLLTKDIKNENYEGKLKQFIEELK